MPLRCTIFLCALVLGTALGCRGKTTVAEVDVEPRANSAAKQHPKPIPRDALQASRPVVLIPDEEFDRDLADHWSFRRLKPITIPRADNDDWSRNPIDQFLLAKMKARGVAPASAVDRRTLLRRMSLTTIGLPPSYKAVQTFLRDRSPDAVRRMADRLLSNPQFGEHAAQVWLDLARYADSNGYEYDEDRPVAFPYRDAVIRAFNSDLPYSQFIRFQIAGDLLASRVPPAVALTGFLTAGPYNTFFPQESERYDELDDIVATSGKAFLGISLGCARCHDHPVEPISTREYYRLVSVFAGSKRDYRYLTPDAGASYLEAAAPMEKLKTRLRKLLELAARDQKIDELDGFTEDERDLLKQPTDPENSEQAELISRAGTRLTVYPADIEDISPREEDTDEAERLKAQIEKLKPSVPREPPLALCIGGNGDDRAWFLKNGDVKHKQGKVPPGFVTLLSSRHPEWQSTTWRYWDRTKHPHPRRAFANWLTDAEEGAGHLLARVIVNRIWQQHFGQPLVRSAGDFGWSTDKPVQFELLDWLANRLIKNRWRLKPIHRLILTSAAYRQSAWSDHRARDPENELFARVDARRMTAEMLRDSLFVVAGNLNSQMNGPGIRPPIPRAAIFNTNEDAGSTWPIEVEDNADVWRRSVYVFRKRSNPVPFLQLFDVPDSGRCCVERGETTLPTQALAMWNDAFVHEQVQRLVADCRDSVSSRQAEVVTMLYRRVYQRDPEAAELARAKRFLGDNNDRLAAFAQVLFFSNEFLYFD